MIGKSNNKVARLWAKDASVWTGADESNWLGWLSIVDEQIANIDALKQLGAEVKKRKSNTRFCSAWVARAFVRKFCA